MKMNKIMAAITATMCGVSMLSAPNSALADEAETENRYKVIEQSLILPEETISTDKALKAFLWDSETNTRKVNAYTALKSDHITIEVHSVEPAVIEIVKEYVKANNLNEALIEYVIDDSEELTDGVEVFVPVTNDELEMLITTLQALNIYLGEKGFIDNSAYASLYWGKHSIECYVQSYAVEYEIKQYIKDNGINEDLITIIIAPDAEYLRPDGGQMSYNEVNTIVADEYITLKKYLNDSGILSNIYLTTKGDYNPPQVPYSCVEIYVKSQEDADLLKNYMKENYYWDAVVEITVQPDLSADTDSTIHSKEYICLEGDANDDGQFGISDVIKLQKYLLAADTICERQWYASDLTGDGTVDVVDLSLSKRKLINR